MTRSTASPSRPPGPSRAETRTVAVILAVTALGGAIALARTIWQVTH